MAPRLLLVDGASHLDAEVGEIERLLDSLCEAYGARAVELTLEIDGHSATRRFTHGSPGSNGQTLHLHEDGIFTAELTFHESSQPLGSTCGIAGIALEQILRRGQLHRQAAMLRSALDSAASAILLFSADGSIVYANAPADDLLSRQTEDTLVVEGSGDSPKPLFSLLCSLVERLTSADHHPASWMGTLAVSDGSVLFCDISALDDPTLGTIGAVVRLETTDAAPSNRITAFAARFGLTQRECEVIRLVTEGLKTPEIAERLHLSPHTVRDHLRSMYRKTGTSSRGELLGLMACSTCTPPLQPAG